MTETVVYDPRRPDTIADPFPAFRVIREESPAYWSDVLGGWVLTRYEDVKWAISDRRFSANRMRPFFERLSAADQEKYRVLGDSICGWAVFHDQPTHTRLRGLMNKAFTVSAIYQRAPRISKIVLGLLDDLGDAGEMDLIGDFAYPLPASVILDMLGLPADDLDQIKGWSDELALFVGSSVNTADKYSRASESIQAMNEYFRRAIHDHRSKPGDDLLTSLIAARDKGDVLSDDELIATCVLLVFAGHETTTNLIGNGLLTLMRHPEKMNQLRRHPELTESAIEELLRYDGPAAALVRIARERIELHGETIEPGDRIFAMLNAANRDPRVFEDPDGIDLGRKENRHLAFGHGIHFCLGAPLARLEGRFAIEAILRRFRSLTLLDAAPPWSDSLVLRGVKSLRVSFAR